MNEAERRLVAQARERLVAVMRDGDRRAKAPARMGLIDTVVGYLVQIDSLSADVALEDIYADAYAEIQQGSDAQVSWSEFASSVRSAYSLFRTRSKPVHVEDATGRYTIELLIGRSGRNARRFELAIVRHEEPEAPTVPEPSPVATFRTQATLRILRTEVRSGGVLSAYVEVLPEMPADGFCEWTLTLPTGETEAIMSDRTYSRYCDLPGVYRLRADVFAGTELQPRHVCTGSFTVLDSSIARR